MFTEEICKKLKEVKIEVAASCMKYHGITIEDSFDNEDKGFLYLCFISCDPYCSHVMKFRNYQPIVRILNAIESELSEWKVVDNDNRYNPEKWETLSAYLERTGQKDNS